MRIPRLVETFNHRMNRISQKMGGPRSFHIGEPRSDIVVPDHELLHPIGRGSYGEVWLARTVMGAYRAVKIVSRSTFSEERPYAREFAGIKRFEPISRGHPGHVSILHIGQSREEGYFYYVMELADDATGSGTTSLDPAVYEPKTLERVKQDRARFPYEEALSLFVALAEALKHLHSHGLVHRDIKPSNIVFIGGVPKLADIGLVADMDATLTVAGTSGFCPPEGPGRPEGDIYSLGKVFYELCTGLDRNEFPKVAPDFGAWADHSQIRELLAVINKACEPHPGKRFKNADELLGELHMLQAGKSVQRLRLLERGRRWAVLGLVASLLLVSVVLSWHLMSRQQQRQLNRQVLLSEAQKLRLGDKNAGWSATAHQYLSAAGQVSVDSTWRDEMAAALEGFDAYLVSTFTASASYPVFDEDGGNLIFNTTGPYTAPAALSQRSITVVAYTNTAPLWFARGGEPRQVGRDGDSLVVRHPGTGRTICQLQSLEGEGRLKVSLFAVSPDGSLAAALCSRGPDEESYLLLWSLQDGRLLGRTRAECSALAFSPDGSCLGTGSMEGAVELRRLPDFAVLMSLRKDRAAVSALCFGMDPRRSNGESVKFPWLMAAGCQGGSISIFSLAEERLLTLCPGAHYDVRVVAFSPDSSTLASGGRGCVTLWDTATGKILLTGISGDWCNGLAFDRYGRHLAVTLAGTPGGGVYDLQRGRGIRSLQGLSAQVTKVAISENSRYVAALAHNWEVGIWDMREGALFWLLQAPVGLLADNAALEFDPSCTRLGFAATGGACVWDLATGRRVKSWSLPSGLGQVVAFRGRDEIVHLQHEDQTNVVVRRLGASVDMLLHVVPGGEVIETSIDWRGESLGLLHQAQGEQCQFSIYKIRGGKLLAQVSLPAATQFPHALGTRSPNLLGYSAGRAPLTEMFDAGSGSRVTSMQCSGAIALRPQRDSMLSRGPEGQLQLRLLHDLQSAWRLGQSVSSQWPVFSMDGAYLAWGTDKCEVLVCDYDMTLQALHGFHAWVSNSRKDE